MLPLHGPIVEGTDEQVFLNASEEAPILLEGTATVNQMVTEARLDVRSLDSLIQSLTDP